MSIPREQLEKWVGGIEIKADKVLDVGGSQLPIKDRVKSWEVEDYKILDLEQPHECKQKPDIEFDLNLIYGGWEGIEFLIEYDVVFCLEVMEYIWNPIQALQNINSLTKKAGILYISFPFIYPIHNPEGADMLRYTRYGAEKLLDQAGFEIIENTPRVNEYIGMPDDHRLTGYYCDQGMRPQKTYKNHEETGYLIKAKKK